MASDGTDELFTNLLGASGQAGARPVNPAALVTGTLVGALTGVGMAYAGQPTSATPDPAPPTDDWAALSDNGVGGELRTATTTGTAASPVPARPPARTASVPFGPPPWAASPTTPASTPSALLAARTQVPSIPTAALLSSSPSAAAAPTATAATAAAAAALAGAYSVGDDDLGDLFAGLDVDPHVPAFPTQIPTPPPAAPPPPPAAAPSPALPAPRLGADPRVSSHTRLAAPPTAMSTHPQLQRQPPAAGGSQRAARPPPQQQPSPPLQPAPARKSSPELLDDVFGDFVKASPGAAAQPLPGAMLLPGSPAATAAETALLSSGAGRVGELDFSMASLQPGPVPGARLTPPGGQPTPPGGDDAVAASGLGGAALLDGQLRNRGGGAVSTGRRRLSGAGGSAGTATLAGGIDDLVPLAVIRPTAAAPSVVPPPQLLPQFATLPLAEAAASLAEAAPVTASQDAVSRISEPGTGLPDQPHLHPSGAAAERAAPPLDAASAGPAATADAAGAADPVNTGASSSSSSQGFLGSGSEGGDRPAASAGAAEARRAEAAAAAPAAPAGPLSSGQDIGPAAAAAEGACDAAQVAAAAVAEPLGSSAEAGGGEADDDMWGGAEWVTPHAPEAGAQEEEPAQPLQLQPLQPQPLQLQPPAAATEATPEPEADAAAGLAAASGAVAVTAAHTTGSAGMRDDDEWGEPHWVVAAAPAAPAAVGPSSQDADGTTPAAAPFGAVGVGGLGVQADAAAEAAASSGEDGDDDDWGEPQWVAAVGGPVPVGAALEAGTAAADVAREATAAAATPDGDGGQADGDDWGDAPWVAAAAAAAVAVTPLASAADPVLPPGVSFGAPAEEFRDALSLLPSPMLGSSADGDAEAPAKAEARASGASRGGGVWRAGALPSWPQCHRRSPSRSWSMGTWRTPTTSPRARRHPQLRPPRPPRLQLLLAGKAQKATGATAAS